MSRLPVLLLAACLWAACDRPPPPREERELAATLLQGVLARRRSGVLGSHGQLDLNLLDHSIATLLAAAASDLQVAT